MFEAFLFSFLSFLCVFIPSIISRSHALMYWESFKDTKSIWKWTHILSWWSWWESHPCLKSYWTTSWGKPPVLFNYIYNNGFGNWPRKCSLRPLPYWKSFAEKNHAAVLVLRHQELWACELLTNRHRRSCLCDFFPPQQPAHNILTSESLFGGVTPSLHLRSFNYLWTTLPETWECLGSKSYTDVASTTM